MIFSVTLGYLMSIPTCVVIPPGRWPFLTHSRVQVVQWGLSPDRSIQAPKVWGASFSKRMGLNFFKSCTISEGDIPGIFFHANFLICSQRSGAIQLTSTAGLYSLTWGRPTSPHYWCSCSVASQSGLDASAMFRVPGGGTVRESGTACLLGMIFPSESQQLLSISASFFWSLSCRFLSVAPWTFRHFAQALFASSSSLHSSIASACILSSLSQSCLAPSAVVTKHHLSSGPAFIKLELSYFHLSLFVVGAVVKLLGVGVVDGFGMTGIATGTGSWLERKGCRGGLGEGEAWEVGSSLGVSFGTSAGGSCSASSTVMNVGWK